MKPVLYVHGGSGNHGCEAIVRTLGNVLRKCGVKNEVVLTANINEDKISGLSNLVNLNPLETKVKQNSLDFLYAYLMNRIFGKYVYLDMLSQKKQIEALNNYDVAIAIGGDTYSYGYTDNNTYMHNLFCRKKMKTVLWGCSIEPKLMEDKRLLKDLCNFDMITTRESITYQALKEHGMKNVWLFPDLAFVLEKKECEESFKIKEGKTIGLNISPLVQNYQRNPNLTLDNYRRMIEYILCATDNDIALIPHVVWAQNDDRKAMQVLYDEYKNTGRVIQISDHNCLELKHIISKCRLFVCARTHASIAAYSTCVPTLVLGYSVKARGIARDIFGTEENYVIPVQSLKSENDMLKAFQWMMNHEAEIRIHLAKVMPEYIAGVSKAEKAIMSLL